MCPESREHRLMPKPAPRNVHLFLACWIGGALGTVMGVGAWVFVLRGGRAYYKNAHHFLSTGETALIATGVLAGGLVLLWLAVRHTPPAK